MGFRHTSHLQLTGGKLVTVNKQDLNRAAKSLRSIVEKLATQEESIQEAQLQDRLLYSADLLQAIS